MELLFRQLRTLILLSGAACALGQSTPPEKAAPGTSSNVGPSNVRSSERPQNVCPETASGCLGVVLRDDVYVLPLRTTPSSLPIPFRPTLAPTKDAAEIIRRVAAHEEENQLRKRNYTYEERVVEKKLDGNGAVKSTETSGFDIMVIYGEQLQRQVSKDDKPLPPKDAAKEEEKIDKLIAKYKNETEDQRAKRLEKDEKSRDETRDFVKEIADAFTFTTLPPETVDGRALYVIQGEPKPGYEPRSKNGKFLTKFRGKIWIDQNEYQWAKVDLETIDTISFGWLVARLHKGTHLYIEQTRVNDEVWLPKLVRLNLGARIALFKDMNVDVTQTYSDYKKFGAQTKIITIGEVQTEKP